MKDFDRLSIVCEVNPLGTDTPTTFSVHCHFFINAQPTDSCQLVLDLSEGRQSWDYPFHRKLYVLALEEWFQAKGSLRLSYDEEDNPALMLDVAFWYGRDFDEPTRRVKDHTLVSVRHRAGGQAADTSEGADDAN